MSRWEDGGVNYGLRCSSFFAIGALTCLSFYGEWSMVRRTRIGLVQ